MDWIFVQPLILQLNIQKHFNLVPDKWYAFLWEQMRARAQIMMPTGNENFNPTKYNLKLRNLILFYVICCLIHEKKKMLILSL